MILSGISWTPRPSSPERPDDESDRMPFLLPWLNLFYFCYLPILSVLFEACFGLPMLAYFCLVRGTTLAEAARRHNQIYGWVVVWGLWPLWRVRVTGKENAPRVRACVIVANHRSFADIFMCSVVPITRPMVMVRSWPFRLPVLGWFMRLARYIDLERMPMTELLEQCAPPLIRRETAFLFFPEGHRSRDGRLQRFRSGAFRLAAAHGLPVLPVVIRGSEQIAHARWPLLQPARVTIDILPLIETAALPGENRMMKLKRAVEEVYRAHLGE